MLVLCLTSLPVRALEPRELQDYQAALQQVGPDPSKLRAVTPVVALDKQPVDLDVGWTRWPASREVKEAIRALESRVDAARWTRPTVFEPLVVRQRLSNLLDRLYPTRIRSLGAPADDPVAVRPTHWTYGTVAYGRGAWSGTTTGGVDGVVRGGGSSSGGGYARGGGRGNGSGGRRNAAQQSSGARVSGGQTTNYQSRPVRNTQPVQATAPTQVQRRQPVFEQTQTARVSYSRPAEAVQPPPKAPAVKPPPPPDKVIEKKKLESTPWWKVLLIVLAAALPLLGWIIWRSRQKGAKKPVARPPKSVADLIDEEHRSLDAAGMARVGRQSAMDEDWMRAMRYLFAAMLTHLTQRRGAGIEDWHTNREIAGLVKRDRKLAETFWSAATIFELFWFGERTPMENDYRLFETLAQECMGRTPEVVSQ